MLCSDTAWCGICTLTFPPSFARMAASTPMRKQAQSNKSACMRNPAVPYEYFTPSGAGTFANAAATVAVHSSLPEADAMLTEVYTLHAGEVRQENGVTSRAVV